MGPVPSRPVPFATQAPPSTTSSTSVNVIKLFSSSHTLEQNKPA